MCRMHCLPCWGHHGSDTTVTPLDTLYHRSCLLQLPTTWHLAPEHDAAEYPLDAQPWLQEGSQSVGSIFAIIPLRIAEAEYGALTLHLHMGSQGAAVQEQLQEALEWIGAQFTSHVFPQAHDLQAAQQVQMNPGGPCGCPGCGKSKALHVSMPCYVALFAQVLSRQVLCKTALTACSSLISDAHQVLEKQQGVCLCCSHAPAVHSALGFHAACHSTSAHPP